MERKKCARCHRDRPLSYFGRDKNRPGGAGKYCQECRREQYLERKAAGSVVRVAGLYTCEMCSDGYAPIHKAQRFCSKSCARRNRRLAPRRCPGCDTEYQPRDVGQKFCARECYLANGTSHRYAHVNGYITIVVPHCTPGARKKASGTWTMLEHRYVMQQALGRPLRDTETVHHINNDRTDNRIENLQLRQGRHGKHSVMVCLDCGSHNVGFGVIADPVSTNTST